MRKLKLKLNPINGYLPNYNYGIHYQISVSVILFLILFNPYSVWSQCVPAENSISGHVLMDMDFNGVEDLTDIGQKDITLSLFDDEQNLIAQTSTDEFGFYQFEELTNGQKFRIEFQLPEQFMHSAAGIENGDLVRFVTVPLCQENLLIHNPMDFSDPNPDIVVLKFIQGGKNENDNNATIVSVSKDFQTDKTITPIARKSETGSVWGMAFSKRLQRIYTSAFIKQYAAMGPNGIGAIYQSSKVNGQYKTSLYVDLAAQGINLGQLSPLNAKDCEYGAQTGKLGIGGFDISDAHNMLYAVNIYNHSLLMIPTTGADASNIQEIDLPEPLCSDGDYYAFALSYYNNKLYVGMTCTAETSKDQADMVGHVYEFDLETESFDHIFETDYLLGYWTDTPSTDVKTKHWLTDISFSDEGNMILSLSDRTGSRFCFGEFGRLDVQNGDILMVWNDNGTWKLEENGIAGNYSGTGINNGQGPGGGEFFGADAWPKNPGLHDETAIGSALVIEGTGEVIVPVYDPENVAYSGGLKRFNTATGEQTGVITLYQHKTYPEFGKAAGFGELALISEGMPIDIGNYVWMDLNKNGVQDASEPGLENIELTLYDDQCNPVGITTSDLNGYYSFKELEADKQYYVVVTDDAFNLNTGFMEKAGSYLYPTIKNKGFGNQKDQNDNDAAIADGICGAIDGFPCIDFKTKGSGENLLNLDIGFSAGKIFDLSLRNMTNSNCQTITPGDTVQFNLEVFNQGTEKAHEIVVTNYLQTGFQFDPDLNPGWKFKEGKVKFKYDGTLDPGKSIVLPIHLIIIQAENIYNYINVAEISSALNSENVQGQDVDSYADDDPDNDTGGVPNMPGMMGSGYNSDNVIDDNGMMDEDDHDPEWLSILDLALRNEVIGDKNVFLPGETVSFKFEIHNQGNIDVESYEITDYLPEGLEFNAALNPGWVQEVPDMVHYTVNTKLYPNSIQSFEIKLKVKEDMGPQDIINVAEISLISKMDCPFLKDFDSTPNKNKFDDIGGEPGSATDNMIFNSVNSIIPDEDDSDPAIIHIQNFDLALTKKVISNNAKPGQLVEFEIEIFNQGIIPADKITIVDYLPAGLSLEDPNWTLDPQDENKAYFTASIENGVLPLLGLTANHSYVIPLTLRVDADQPLGLITNVAEIMEAYDISGNNLGIYDEDSTPDDNQFNDAGGQPNTITDNNISDDGTIDEDDSDPAQIYISNVELVQNCVCLMNASNTDDGQFQDEWSIQAPTGQSWSVNSNNGIINLNIGDPLIENVIGNGYSNYAIAGIHLDGTGYEIGFINNLGDVENYLKAPGTCVYEDLIIDGVSGTCGSTSEVYTILNPDPDATYHWTVSGGGVISGSDTGNSIIIDWGGTLGGPYLVSAQNIGTPVCQAPNGMEVTIGNSSGTLVSKDEIIISIGQNCEVEVTADVILTYGYSPVSVYDISLQLPDGTVLPSNVITWEYLYTPIMVNLVDMCGGNSAMSQVTAIDKLPPTIDCSDEIVLCDNMDEYEGPTVSDNCDPDPQAILVNEEVFNEDCNSQYSQRIVRTYVALDASGNFSEPCQKTIYTQRANTNDLVWPENLLLIDNSAIVCGTYPTCDVCDCETFPYPDPLATGTPTLNGEPIYPSTLGHCQYVVGFEDLVLIDTPCFKKMIRFWSVHEICGGVNVFNVFSYQQDIEIIDNIPPIPEAPNNITLHTNGESCGSMVQLPALTVTDNCDSEINIDVTYPGGFLENSNGGNVWMPSGEHKVWYTIYDECENYSQVELNVTIEDHIPPVAVCQQNTVVALTIDGFAEVPALVFDSGSYDDCTIVHMEVKRLEEESTCGLSQNEFGPTVTFCCADVGSYVTVILKVYDDHGNWNECEVEVLVQDANPPILTIPSDRTIECSFHYDLEDLSYFGNASVYDVCGAEISEEIFTDISTCGVGYIDRIFTASDGQFTVTETQRITIINSSPYELVNIDWPDDYLTAESCNAGDLSPQNLDPEFAFPVFNNETYCDDLSFDYDDEIFLTEEEGNACYKIVRKWVVRDWCHFENGEYKTWMWEQIIMVINSIPPVIVSDLEPIVECSFDNDCQSGYVELTATGDDDCTPGNNLYWEYAIDLNNDYVLDIEGNYTGGTLDLSGEYPIGEHKVFWRLNDYCGNTTNQVQYFTIENCTTPTAICMDAVSIGIQATDLTGDGIPDTEMAVITANEFNAGSYHPCGYSLFYSFSEDILNTTLTVDCSDLSQAGIQISLYVTDPFGNFDFCETILYVQDNNLDETCDTYDECLIYPDTELTVESCDPDLSPEALGTVFDLSVDCPCTDFDQTYVDTDISDPNSTCTTIQRDWTLSFNCGIVKTYYFTQTITVLNVSAPELICVADIQIDAQANCETFVSIGVPAISNASCNNGMFITHNSIYADDPGENASGTYPVGTTVVEFTLEDECGNQSTCEVLVTVTDVTDPICVANDLSLTIGANGTVIITAEQIDGGSTDECGIGNMSVTPNSFTCNDIGDNTVTLTVTDVNGNSSSCTATVTIEDNSGPLCSTQDLTIILDENGLYVVDPYDIYTGSPCGGLNVTLDLDINTFTCDDIGENAVVLTVTESNGNSESCGAIITVTDTIAPLCLLLDIDAYLDENGEVSVSFEDINDGTMDTCGEIIDTTITNTNFDCGDVGQQIVTVTCEDNSGNISVCEAIVTVIDTIAPVCMVNDITVQIGGTGQAVITGQDLDAGSTDECGISTITVIPDTFTCSDVGDNVVTVTVTDSNGVSSTCTATVTVEDESGPLCNTQDIAVILDANGQYFLDPEEIYAGNPCGGGSVSLEVEPNLFECDDIGFNTVTLTVTDEFGTTDVCTATVEVSDTIAPLCQVQDVNIYLDIDGNYELTLDDINNGTTDLCGMIVDTSITPSLFGCDDLGVQTVVVSLTDNSGNVSTCEAEVTVIDSIAPNCIADDFVLNLDDTGMAVLTAEMVDGGSTDECLILEMTVEPDTFYCNDIGFIEVELTVTDASMNTSTCMSMVEVVDVIPPELSCPADTVISCMEWPITDYSVFGEPTSFDECAQGAEVTESVIENVNDCGLGIVTRVFTIVDNSGNVNTCTQIISLESTGNQFSEDNIIWGPATINTDGCSDLDIFTIGGAPTYMISDAECYMLNDFYVDVDLNPDENCLDTIQRTWTVIDSCQLNPVTGEGMWTFEQMIFAIDTILPIIVGPADTTVCETSYVDLYGYATDCGTEDAVTVTNDSPYADDQNSGDASGDYPYGVHDITITAVDACGNIASYTYELTVYQFLGECRKVIRDIEDDLMYVLYLDEVWFPNPGCFDPDVTEFSLSDTNIDQDTLHFDCSDIPEGQSFVDIDIPVYMWVNGVYQEVYCESLLTLEDPNGFCDGNSTPIVSGVIETYSGKGVGETEVLISGSESFVSITDDTGAFAFNPMMSGNDYVVSAERDHGYLDGVSTLDLIFMQRHILGINVFDAPYKYIAADINRSSTITASDMLELRNLILGVSEAFTNNTSWRFVPVAHDFSALENPLISDIQESYIIENIDGPEVVDFYGIKIGDLNDSANANGLMDLEKRDNEKVVLATDVERFVNGQQISVPVLIDQEELLNGLQFTLNFDPSKMSFVDIESGRLNITSANYNAKYMEDGKISLSWNVSTPVQIEKDNVLFSFVFIAKETGLIRDHLRISSDLVKAEWYSTTDDIKNITLRIGKGQDFELFQNNPNPWANSTEFTFNVPDSDQVKVKIRDIYGNLIKSMTMEANAGMNRIIIDRDDLEAQGILVFELEYRGLIKNKKMIKIN